METNETFTAELFCNLNDTVQVKLDTNFFETLKLCHDETHAGSFKNFT